MKMIFIDAENIGLKEVEKIDTSILDKVFVFSKNDAVKKSCEKQLYLILSGYPDGSNQADFYIIAYLARILATIPKNQMNTVDFELHTDDKYLISAFEFQCQLLGSKCTIISPKKIQQNIEQKLDGTNNLIDTTIENLYIDLFDDTSEPRPNGCNQLLDVLKTPHKLSPELRHKLQLSQSDFSLSINHLIRENRIKRTIKSKQLWVIC